MLQEVPAVLPGPVGQSELKMKFADLFSGIGGFRLALERVGAECVFACEINEYARRIYSQRFEVNHPYPKDIREVKQTPDCDLICAGVPCQDVSVAGKRKGLYGEKTGLFFDFIRLLEQNQPRWVLFENVPGLLSSNRGRDFAVVLDEMGKCGYGLCWRILDSRYFGVPQRRRRLFIVGHLGGLCPPEILFESEGGRGNSAKVRKAGQDIARCLGSSPGGVSGKETQQTLVTVLPWGEGGLEPSRASMLVPALTGQQPRFSDTGAEFFVLDAYNQRVSDKSPTFCGSRNAVDKIPAVLKDSDVRRLTPLECERLQGFPDGWTEGLSDTQRYKCLGNAVTVSVIEWLGKRIMEAA